MATVIFMPFHWDANINSTFAIARGLRKRGHHVHYLCIPDNEERIRAQGFDFIQIFSEVFPKGALQEQYSNEANGKYQGLDGFRARILGMCDLMLKNAIGKALRGLHPDLFFVSSATPWIGIGAQTTGVPVITFSSSLISVWDSLVPPFETALIPDSTPSSRIKNVLAWRWSTLRRWMMDVGRPSISNDVREFARRCKYPLEGIDFNVETWPLLKLPNLIFCPKNFDFPRSREPESTYFVEPSIDAERVDGDFSWGWLREDKPLIYCSLGSVAPFKYARRAARFFQVFMDAMAKRPGRQGVVTIGGYLRAEVFDCPPNVLIVRKAPQIEMLKRASVMVGHGGFSGIKECIFTAVPMALFPMFYDHPGNAARVVYHGLGVRGKFDQIDATGLNRLIDDALENPSYSAKIKAMSQTFVELQRRQPGVDVIENILLNDRGNHERDRKITSDG
jgi:zeaxanthin glucosyltransferase